MLPTRFHVPRRTQDLARPSLDFVYGTCTLFGWPFNAIPLSSLVTLLRSYYPDFCRFGLLQFRSPLLSESFLFSSPLGTKMFQFPRLSPITLSIHVMVTQYYLRWVPPFGYPRIYACFPLPEAFRRLLRPSSALYATGIHRTPFVI